MKTVKLNYSKILVLQNYINGTKDLPGFKTKTTPIGWAVIRTSIVLDKKSKDYYEQLEALIKLHSEKNEDGTSKLKEGTTGKDITEFVFKDLEGFVKDFNDLQLTEVELDIFEASKEKVNEYINTNPAPSEYEIFIDTIINPEFVA